MTNSPHTCAGAWLEKNGTREKGEETKKKKAEAFAVPQFGEAPERLE